MIDSICSSWLQGGCIPLLLYIAAFTCPGLLQQWSIALQLQQRLRVQWHSRYSIWLQQDLQSRLQCCWVQQLRKLRTTCSCLLQDRIAAKHSRQLLWLVSQLLGRSILEAQLRL